jgi:glycosyltransferase involved in cell wall biosynthesis
VPSVKKNIIIVLPFFTLGGAETQAYYVAEGLKDNGHNVTVIAFQKKNGALIKKLDEGGINWVLSTFDLSLVHQSGIKKLSRLFKFGRFLKSFNPDCLLPFTYYPNILCSSVSFLTGAKVCFWNQRGMESLGISLVEKIAKSNRPIYLANSIACAKFISTRHGFKESEVQIISNGIELKEPKNDIEYWSQKISKKNSELIYVMVANFFTEKNHLYLLKAWLKFCEDDKGQPKKLVLVGYSPNSSGLNEAKAFVYDYNIYNVVFLESTDDIIGLLNVCDVGVLTSSSEGCPNSVLEYMLYEKIAVVSKIAATEEIFGDDYEFFCDLENTDSLVQVLQKTTDHQLCLDQVKINKDRVLKKYSILKLKSAYNKLLL